MGRVAYVNGRYVRQEDAVVNIEDRGYQFADGVYEVYLVRGGHPIDNEGHMRRLGYSLGEMRIDWPLAPRALELVMRRLIRKNRVDDGLLYLQITRGVAARNHLYPDPESTPSAIAMTTRPIPKVNREVAEKPVSVVTLPDIRWKRRDIKTISLLPNCMARQKAFEAGAYEAWQIDEEGMVTEGTSSNAWIVSPDGVLLTRPASHEILNGITRLTVLKLAGDHGLAVQERRFSLEEAYGAREAFCTGTTTFVKPVVKIDDRTIGVGAVGPFCKKLLDAYFRHMRDQGAPI